MAFISTVTSETWYNKTSKNDARAQRQLPPAWDNLYERSTMRKRTTTPAVGQLSLLDYKPDPYAFFDQIDNASLYGHLLAYQQTPEFRADLATQFEREASRLSCTKEYNRQSAAKYRERHPDLAKRRWRLTGTKERIKSHLLKQQGGTCHYCRCELDGKTHIDHRVPMIKGGSDEIENLVLTCEWCNLHKHVMSESKWRSRLAYIVRSA